MIEIMNAISRELIFVGFGCLCCKQKFQPGNVFFFNFFYGRTLLNLEEITGILGNTRQVSINIVPLIHFKENVILQEQNIG